MITLMLFIKARLQVDSVTYINLVKINRSLILPVALNGGEIIENITYSNRQLSKQKRNPRQLFIEVAGDFGQARTSRYMKGLRPKQKHFTQTVYYKLTHMHHQSLAVHKYTMKSQCGRPGLSERLNFENGF